MRRRLTPQHYREIVRRHLPPGWCFIERRPPGLLGDCDYDTRRLRFGPLLTRDDLYVALHEIGHARLHSPPRAPNASLHVEEYEAEQYAIGVMRIEGIPVPREHLRLAKENVLWHIERDRKRGWLIDAAICKWATPKERVT